MYVKFGLLTVCFVFFYCLSDKFDFGVNGSVEIKSKVTTNKQWILWNVILHGISSRFACIGVTKNISAAGNETSKGLFNI